MSSSDLRRVELHHASSTTDLLRAELLPSPFFPVVVSPLSDLLDMANHPSYMNLVSPPSKSNEDAQLGEYVPAQTIFLHPEDYEEDVEVNLGRANGNTYRRKAAIENVHDGQIMVRLKKKRFIIIDYGYTPNPHDFEIAKANPHIGIPTGAGQKKCSAKTCTRIGVPCLLHDSDPNEPVSLYLRGGLCFCCQRNLNEKRRTTRKRKSDGLSVGDARVGDVVSIGSTGRASQLSGFIEGPVEGTKSHGPDYRHPEIGSDLLRIVSELSQETLSLMQHSSGVQAGAPPTTDSINQKYDKAIKSASRATFLLTQWKASYDAQHQKQAAQKQPPVVASGATAAAAVASCDTQGFDEAVSGRDSALGSLVYHANTEFANFYDPQDKPPSPKMQELMRPATTAHDNEESDKKQGNPRVSY